MRSVNFEHFKMYFYEDSNEFKLLYVFIVDSTDDPEVIFIKMKKVSSIFDKKYRNILSNYNGRIHSFDEFSDILIETNIAQKNCGVNPDCNDCPNSVEDSKILEIFKKKKLKFVRT